MAGWLISWKLHQLTKTGGTPIYGRLHMGIWEKPMKIIVVYCEERVGYEWTIQPRQNWLRLKIRNDPGNLNRAHDDTPFFFVWVT